MANSGDDQNLVSQIQVTGDEESAKKIETFADRGAAAFGKLDTAAKPRRRPVFRRRPTPWARPPLARRSLSAA
jgi:hypothetical protein